MLKGERGKMVRDLGLFGVITFDAVVLQKLRDK
jgi:hypothetical protein